jgi:hypothetical protein
MKAVAGSENKLVMCILKCLRCCMECFERFIKFLNKQAYIQVEMQINILITRLLSRERAFVQLPRTPGKPSGRMQQDTPSLEE